MHPRGRTTPPLASAWSSCTIAHQPTENGEAEPQSIDRKRIQSSGMANGGTTCLLPSPAIEECPHGDGPIAVQPRAHQFLAARRPQPLLVRFNVNVLVIVDPRRDEHSLEPGQMGRG